MEKIKKISAEDITEKDILSLYERTLPLLYREGNAILSLIELDECLTHFVAYDSHYFLALNPEKKLDNIISIRTDTEKNKADFSIKTTPMKDADTVFDEIGDEFFQTYLRKGKSTRPGKQCFDHYRMMSREEPKAMAVFFRFFRNTEDKTFTEKEKSIFAKLTPHVLSLIRTFHTFVFQSESHQYFKTYTDICSRLAADYDLSDMEYKIMVELLFGKSNEAIAKENFISIAAVKKHINRLFKKTGSKSRIDFVGNFFTSPDRVRLSEHPD